jgi:eukaryotic-like serine/threonine-protein kinase
MADDYKYFAFISYSHADEKWSRWLHGALETYRAPKRLVGRITAHGPVPGRLTPVFRDRDELTGAADLSSTVTAALEASRHLIVICSPSAARSRWVDEEVRAFKRMGRSNRILTLVVDGEPNASTRPGQESQDCFAPSLRFELDPDDGLSTRAVEPIAADLRPGKDGRSNAKLKLIGGLLGVGFDELKQREHRRQQRRLLLITATSLAGVLITGALAITASIARQDAVRNRDSAEDLIGFMLGDFRQHLEPVGRLEVLKIVGDKAMVYFSSLNERDITNESLLRRAEALRQIGDVRLSLGEFEPALAAFQESLNLSRDLSNRSPNNQDWLFALGNAWFWVGYTHWQTGELGAAVAPMTEYFRIAERLVELDAGNREWQLERGYALGNLGGLAFARGGSDEAIRHYESARNVIEGLLEDAPADVDLQRARIEFHSWLASIRESRGELSSARDLHARTLQLTTELLASRPDDRHIQREQVLRQVFYGRVLLLMGDLGEAQRVSSEALNHARALAIVDPENARWQWQLASVMEQECRVLRASRRCTEAVSVAEEGLAVTADLVETAAGMDVGNLTRWRLLSEKAACLLEARRLQESRMVLAPLLEHARVPDEKSVNAVHYEVLLATSRYLAGQVLAAEGDTDQARLLWAAGLDMVNPGRTDPRHRAIRAMLLQALDRAQEAKALAAELSNQGFAEPNFTRQMAALYSPN